MTRDEREYKLALELLEASPHADLQKAAALFRVALAQASDTIGPPPYMPYGWNRVNLNVTAKISGVPVEDL